METALTTLVLLGLLGGIDVLWFHLWKERLHTRAASGLEQKLHGIREILYGYFFVALAWWQWHGVWAWVFAGVVLVDLVLTAWDVVVEQRSRRVSSAESLLHWTLTVIQGVYLTQLAPILDGWAALDDALQSATYGATSYLLTLLGMSVAAWGLLDLARNFAQPLCSKFMRAIRRPTNLTVAAK